MAELIIASNTIQDIMRRMNDILAVMRHSVEQLTDIIVNREKIQRGVELGSEGCRSLFDCG